ncbi:MAG: hypothetical protein MN733_05280 [Nitrososphaera sp.]|nr:hypothetical protein [Nitrososphaera sp.]
MTAKTEAESIFEEFCALNSIACKKIGEGEQPTPDYEVLINEQTILVEVKQIDEDDNFSEKSGSRRVGSHIRKKIEQARKQAQTASNEGKPFILLVYNNSDKMQIFGTEQHDFVDAMYGETTLVFDKTKNAITDSFQGRNRSLGDEKNTSFSAVGNFSKTHRGIEVRIYENIFAKHKLDFSKLPTCIESMRIEVEKSNA